MLVAAIRALLFLSSRSFVSNLKNWKIPQRNGCRGGVESQAGTSPPLMFPSLSSTHNISPDTSEGLIVMSYLPFRRTTRSSASQPITVFDFGAFGEEEVNEADETSASQPLAPQHPDTSSSSTSRSPPSSSYNRYSPSGTIALNDSHDDPLTRTGNVARNGSSASNDRAIQLPGAYDFEPQPSQGGHVSASIQTNNSAIDANAVPANQSEQTRFDWRQRFLPAAILDRLSPANSTAARETNSPEEFSGLLSNQDGQDSLEETDSEQDARRNRAYPPSHVPLPARPPQFSVTPNSDQTGSGAPGGRIYGGGSGNDGVFANLSAKPDGMNGRTGEYVGGDDGNGGDKDEVLPAYEIAALDTSPPYWESSVVVPAGLGDDDVIVDGLPVGNLFIFFWNVLVSSSFQFVGFLLTYLLHTTHAAKNGSRAGLGITLIQLGLYLKQRVDHPELFQYEEPSVTPGQLAADDGMDLNQGWTWWGGLEPETASAATSSLATTTLSALGSIPTQVHGALSGAFEASDPDVLRHAAKNATMPSLTGQLSQQELMEMSSTANEWMAFMMIMLGTFLLVGSCLAYWRAVRWSRAVRAGQGPGATEA